MKRKLYILAAGVVVCLLLVCGMIGAVYESPLSIFLSAEDSDSDETGYEIIIKELMRYYADLEDTVNTLAAGTPNTTITNSLARTNMADVSVIYVTLASSDEFKYINPCDFTSLSYGDKNREMLKKVFDLLNTYTTQTVQNEMCSGGIIGNYSICSNDDSMYYIPNDETGECLVSEQLLSVMPMGTHISIDGVEHRVAGTVDGVDDNTISICKSSEEPTVYTGQIKPVAFVATPIIQTLSCTETQITYVQYQADDYIKNYGLDENQMEFYAEIASELDELQQMADISYENVNENWTSVDLGDVEPINPNESQREFIESIGNAAVKYYSTYQVLPSLTIAQAINESSWGSSGLAAYHNYFGMKYTEGCGTAFVTKQTNEQLEDGSYITINAPFRAYTTREEGIKGYYEFLQYPRYSNLRGVTDYREATTLIKQDGWATSHAYTENLQRLIIQYSLTDFDRMAGAIP